MGKHIEPRPGSGRLLHCLKAVMLPVLILCVICFSPALKTAAGENETDQYGKETALVINGETHTLAEFNYYFNAWYSSFTQSNASYIPYMFDESKSLKDQEYEEGRSWFDYFVDQAALSMQQIIVVSDLAKEEGLTLSQADLDKVEEVYDALTGFAETFEMDPSEYLKIFYGDGMDPELFRQCLTDTRLADAYSGQVKASYEPDGEEIEAYYREHLRDYTTVQYERYFARASAMGTVPTPEQKEEAHQLAQEIYQEVSEGTPLKEAAASHEEEGVYYAFDDAAYIEGSVYGDWLFDPQRAEGDLLLTEEVNGWYVMVFHAANEADYLTAEVLDAYFPLDTALADTDEQLEDSCLKAEKFLEEWKEAGADEAAFTDMVKELAESTGAQPEYSSVLKGTFDEGINDWIFDGQRKAGDCEVLYSAQGFHVVYLRGWGGPAWESLVRTDLQEKEYQAWFDDLMASSEMTRCEEVLAHAGGYE